MEIDLNECNNLEDLFGVWKQAHENDKNWKQTFPECPCCKSIPPESFKRSFTVDGVLSEESKLLFIGRESNVSYKINSVGETEDYFWMRDGSDKTWRSYKKYLGEISNKLIFNENYNYMNINKRGGYGACTFERLYNYVVEYKEFIKKEISIINPDIIVFLGAGEYKYLKEMTDIIKDISNKKEIKCYAVCHPSYPKKYDELENRLKNKLI